MKKILLLLFSILFINAESKAQENEASDVCSRIERKVDEIEGEIQLNSPLINGSALSSLIIYKDIKNGKAVYYLSLKTRGSTVVVDGKGATILFTDGTKLKKEEDIDVDSDESGFKYSAFITLTPADLVTFSTKKIKMFRLYIFDKIVSPEDSEEFTAYVSCIKKQK